MRIDRLLAVTALAAAFVSSAAAQAPSYQQAARLPARILSFTAEPASIQPGESVTLRWAVENPLGSTIDQGIGVVTPRGGRRLSPPATTTYTLTVRGPNNQVITKDVTVTVAGTTRVRDAGVPEIGVSFFGARILKYVIL